MIDQHFSEAELLSGLLCKAFSRHLLDGNVFIESDRWNNKVWVARLECTWCRTLRVTTLEPESMQQIGQHTYDYTRDYDKSIRGEDARRTVMARLMRKK